MISFPFASAASAMSQSDSVVMCVKFSNGTFGKGWKKDEAYSSGGPER
jgi:hypothetical protein